LFERRLVQLTRLVVTLGIAANIPIIAFNGTFFRLWQPSLHFGGEALTLCASLNSIFMAIMSLWGWVYTGTGRIDRLVPLTVIAAAVNLVISIAMTRAGFVFGPVFGTTIGIGVIGFLWYPLEMRRTFGLSPANLYRAVVVPFIPGVIYGSVVVWFGHRFLSAGWIGLAVLTAMAGGGYLVLAAFTVLGAGERRMLRARIVSRIYTKPATETVSPRG
jgi:hypothetical protein